MINKDNIAVLITCYNRANTTLRCLDALFAADAAINSNIDVYLVDDGSTDNTTPIVKTHYPKVNIIQGNGALYWCGGMRLAWESAASKADYKFYLLLNDDVVVNKDFWDCLITDYNDIIQNNNACLITGACSDPVTGEFTYGGRNKKFLLPPNGEPQRCIYIHGNIILVPRKVYKKIGLLSESFTHAFGDTDYGLRAIEAGFSCWTTSKYIGKCKQHRIKGPWASSNIPVKKRLSLFTHPRGLNFKEYVIYKKYHWPQRWLLDVAKVCIQVLFPYPFEIFSKCRAKILNNIKLKFK